jgi:Papain fold toxin 1, glutamine deamidase
MGLGSFLSGIGDGAEHLATGAEHLAGEAVEGASGTASGLLNDVGLHSAAQDVQHFGDKAANDLGAQVPEEQLGQSSDPTDLVHGDVGAIERTSSRLSVFHSAFEQTYQALSQLDTGHWEGAAADAFRARYLEHPKLWANAADACAEAGRALTAYAHAVTWAQGQAEQAIKLYAAGQQATQDAASAHDEQVDAYNRQATRWDEVLRMGGDPSQKGAIAEPVAPPPFRDPGTARREQAQDILSAARRQRDAQAGTATRAITAAMALAPTEPSFLQRMSLDGQDLVQDSQTEMLHFYGGVLKGTAGIVRFASTLNPMNPYNLTHPATYLDGLSNTAAGLVHAANNPTVLLKSMVGSGWSTDPAQAFGNLIPNVLLSVATDGGGAAADAAEDAGVGAAEKDAATSSAATAPPGPQVIHTGSLPPDQAQALLDQEFPFMRTMNKPRFDAGVPGYNQNCSQAVEAVNRNLDGVPTNAKPLMSPEWPSAARLGSPSAQFADVSGYDDISKDIAAGGDGARGVVYIARDAAHGNSAHVFNVINSNGRVIYLDGQTGTLGTLETDGITNIQFMRYR